MPQPMRTANPALSAKAFAIPIDAQAGQFTRYGGGGFGQSLTGRMTLNGTINKTGILLVCAMATALYTWHLFLAQGEGQRDASQVAPLMLLGMIAGLVFAMVTIFKKEWAAVTAPAYALSEGLALGGLSAIFELRYPGIAIQSVALTFGTLFALLLAYRSGLIQVTQKFRLGVTAATGAIFLFYLAQMVLGLFHVSFAAVNNASPLSIGISLIIVGVAALNLVLDFDMIESGVRAGAPKYMEWYGAFGLMVTLVWLYLEILRLLSKFRSRN